MDDVTVSRPSAAGNPALAYFISFSWIRIPSPFPPHLLPFKTRPAGPLAHSRTLQPPPSRQSGALYLWHIRLLLHLASAGRQARSAMTKTCLLRSAGPAVVSDMSDKIGQRHKRKGEKTGKDGTRRREGQDKTRGGAVPWWGRTSIRVDFLRGGSLTCRTT